MTPHASEPPGPMSEGNHFYARVFAIVTAALLALAVFRILQPFIGAILWSLLLAFLLSPVNVILRRTLGHRRAAAALLLTVGVILVLVGPVLLLSVAFANQAAELFQRVQGAAGQLQVYRPSDLLQLPIIHRAMQWLEGFIPISADQVQAWLANAATTALRFLVATSGVFVVEALGTLVSLIITLFLLFFFLRDGEEVTRRVLSLIPLAEERRGQLVVQLSAVIRAVVFGSLVTAIVQGALLGIAFAVLRLPSPVVFGVLGAAASLIPFVGTALVWVPGVAVLGLQGRWGAAVFLAAWSIVVVGTADNFVRPLFISGRAQMSTLPAFLGVAGGLSAFGFIGLVLGPVIVALVLALLRFAEESRAAPPASASETSG